MSDIVEELRTGAACSAAWGRVMQKAALEIERLRSIAGKADVGPSFSELTDELRGSTSAHYQTPSE